MFVAPNARRLRVPLAAALALAGFISSPSHAGDPPKPAPTTAATSKPTAAPTAVATPPAPTPTVAATAAPTASGELVGEDAPPAMPPGPTSNEPIDEATMLFDMGTAAMDEGKFAEAAEMLTKVWAKTKTYDVAAALGTAELQLGRFRDAAEHLSFAKKNLPPSELGSTQKSIADAFAKARQEVAELRVTVNLPGATVRIDRWVLGGSPLSETVFVNPGSIVVTAEKEGFEGRSTTVMAPKGGAVTADIVLTGRDRTPAYILGGVGVGAIIAGVALLGVSESKFGEARSVRDSILKSGGSCGGSTPQADCSKLKDAGAISDATGTASFVAFGVGVAALGAGLAYYFWPVQSGAVGSKTALTARVIPVVSPSQSGLVVSGSF
ncbi:MAG: PEGA domain-containing protein [Polyangiaceae bacterium]|nr:PEGA domain-containing protein [Polyangiaceae bacterium]